jgi:hypothetical protein
MYRRENGRLRRVGEVTLTRGDILPMTADTLTQESGTLDVVLPRPFRSIGLHLR